MKRKTDAQRIVDAVQPLMLRAEANFKKLPVVCYVLVPAERIIGKVVRGEPGYYKTPPLPPSCKDPQKFCDELNRDLGVTPAQAEAMLNGSMWGWHVPAADPDHEINRRVAASR